MKTIIQARKYFKQGKREEAEKICRSLLKKGTDLELAMFLLATIQLADRRFADAKKSANQLLLANPAHAGALNILAVICLEADQDLVQAEIHLKNAIEVDPTDWQAYANLGQLLISNERAEEGTRYLHKSLSLEAANFAAHNGLGMYDMANGFYAAAAGHFRQAKKIDPSNSTVTRNLASCLAAIDDEKRVAKQQAILTRLSSVIDRAREDDLSGAEADCAALLQDAPDNVSVLHAYAAILQNQGRYDEAANTYRLILTGNPDQHEAAKQLAMIEASLSESAVSVEEKIRQALEASPEDWRLHATMGNIMFHQNRYEDAEGYFKKSLALQPSNYPSLNGLGMLSARLQEHGVAADYFREAHAVAPFDASVNQNLIQSLTEAKRKDEALEICEHVATLEHPGIAAFTAFSFTSRNAIWSTTERLIPHLLAQLESIEENAGSRVKFFAGANLGLMAKQEISNEIMFRLHKGIGSALVEARNAPSFADHPKAFTSRDRLRIGYVSGDFCNHAVSVLFSHILANHDRSRVELFLYSALPMGQEDITTAKLRKSADHFIRVAGTTDQELSTRIRDDGINILIDLSGYTYGSRIAVMPYRPAPLQMIYLGYPGSTGITEVDHIISDKYLDGPENARYFVEAPLHMPECFVCFGPLQKMALQQTSPFERNGYVTFGSLMAPYKFNKRAFDLWGQILKDVPDSRVLLNHPEYSWHETRKRITAELVARGIPEGKIEIQHHRHASGSHLHHYDEIDISLDTMPLTGGNTTIDALQMGVPVVTRVGDAYHERITYSLLMNAGIGLSDLVAFSDQEYITKAVALATNHERLHELHQSIPAALPTSILCDAKRFTQQLEEFLEQAWNQHFPDTPVAKLCVETAGAVDTNKNLGVISITTSGDNIYSYVMQEQGGWYAADYPFLKKIGNLFSSIVDAGDDPGIYALALALAQSGSGKTVAIRTDPECRRLIEKSTKNNRLGNLAVLEQLEPELPPPDLLRLTLSGDSLDPAALDDILSWAAPGEPLIVVSLTRPSPQLAAELFNVFSSAGYRAYRLLPGFELLAPLGSPENIPAGTDALFFTRQERARRLGIARLAASTIPAVEAMPATTDNGWHRLIGSCPGLRPILNEWMAKPSIGEWGDVYLTLLNLIDSAYRPTTSPGQRVARLELALSMVNSLIAAEATVPRLLSGIRLMHDAGLPLEAAKLCGYLIDNLSGKSGMVLNEPFLPPLPEWGRWKPDADQASWAYSLALAAKERLLHPTSYHSPEKSLLVWHELHRFPWFQAEAKRRMAVIAPRLTP